MKNDWHWSSMVRLVLATLLAGTLAVGGRASTADTSAKGELLKWQLGSGDGRIHVIPTLSAPSVKNGGKLTIQAVVKAVAGVAKVEAEIEGVARLELKPMSQASPSASASRPVAIYQAEWTARGLEEKVYPVTLRITDRTGHVCIDRSLSFSDPAAGNSTPGNPAGSMPQLAGMLGLRPTENDFQSAVLDSAGGYAYFGTRTSPGIVVKVRLADFTRVGALVLNAGENNLLSAVIDPAAGYAYFATDGSPARVVKVRLADFTRVGALTLHAGENQIRSGAIDPAGGYAYFGTYTTPGRVVRMRLADFTHAGALTLHAGENQLTSAVIDPAGGNAWFGTGTSPGIVVKVRLADFTRAEALTLNTGEDQLSSAIIDPASGYAWFGTFTVPGRVVRIRLVDCTHAGTLTLQAGEDHLESAVIDTAGGYAYFSTCTSPGRVVKVRLPDFTRIGALMLSNNAVYPTSALIDPSRGYAWFGSEILCSASGGVNRIRLSDFTNAGALTMKAGEDYPTSAMIDPTGNYAYFGITKNSSVPDISPGSVVKVRLADFTRVGALALNTGEAGLTSGVIDPAGQYAYFFATSGEYNVPGSVVKVRLADFTRVGALKLTGAGLNCEVALIDPDGEYAYFGTYSGNYSSAYGRVVKVRLSDFSSVGTLPLDPGEGFILCGAIDPAGQYAYFGASNSPTPGKLVKVRLTDMTRVEALTFDAGEEFIGSAILDPAGSHAYLGVDNKVLEVQLTDFTRKRTLTLDSSENLIATSVMDPAGEYAWFGIGAHYWNLVKVRLADLTRMGTLSPNLPMSPWVSPFISAVYDPLRGCAYFGACASAGQILKMTMNYKTALRANRITLSERGVVKDVRFYSHAARGKVRLAIYSDETTKSLLWESAATSNTAAGGWLTVPVAVGTPKALTLAPGQYWLAWQSDATAEVPSYALGTEGEGFAVDQPFGAFPASLGAAAAAPTSDKWSEYLTYTIPPLAAPGTPGASGIGMRQITWRWTDNSEGETGFKVWADAGAATPTTLRTTTAANATSWTMTGLVPNTDYTFRVAATGATGDSSRTANFTARTLAPPPVAPAITAQPASRTVNPGQAASFSVAVSGTAPLSYQWKKNGVDLARGKSATLTIGAAGYGDAGFYTCVVSNGGGQAISQAARLVVNPTLTIASAHGVPSPVVGTAVYTTGTQVTAKIAVTTLNDSADPKGTTRWVCTGWTATGAAPARGTGTSVTFKLTQPTTITWQWKTQYKLTATADPASRGSVKLADGVTAANGTWYDSGQKLTLRAVPNSGSRFAFWWGGLGGRTNPASLTMGQPATVGARFDSSKNAVAGWEVYGE